MQNYNSLYSILYTPYPSQIFIINTNLKYFYTS